MMAFFSEDSKTKAGWVQKIKEDLSFYVDLYVKGKVPIVVYQMGRVGSRSVRDALQLKGYDFVFHVHRMNPGNLKIVRDEYLSHNQPPPKEKVGRMLYRHVVLKQRPAKFVTLVREPVARNISAFFRNFRRFTGRNYSESGLGLAGLIEAFIKSYNHTIPLRWFDEEPKRTLNVDVYNYPFPKEKGYRVIKKGPFEMLVIKLELENYQKEKAIAEFFQVESLPLVEVNKGEQADYGPTYKEFVRSIRLPVGYIEEMYQSKYAKHFYSDEEIDRFRKRWLGECL